MERITQPPHDQYYFARISSPSALNEKFPPGSAVRFTSEVAKGDGRVVGFVRAPGGSYQHMVLIALEKEVQWSLLGDQTMQQYPVLAVRLFEMHQGFITHWNVIAL
jgi:hypothetical protein